MDTDLTKLQWVLNRLACIVTKLPFTCSAPLLRSLQWLPVSSLFIFTPYFPHHSHPGHWDQAKELVCQSLGSIPTQTQELFPLVLCLFGTTCCCLSIKPFQLLPSRNIWRHISLTWPFPLRHWHTRHPLDAMELFHQFCYWTLIRLSRHWVWHCQGYWSYRNWMDDWYCVEWYVCLTHNNAKVLGEDSL